MRQYIYFPILFFAVSQSLAQDRLLEARVSTLLPKMKEASQARVMAMAEEMGGNKLNFDVSLVSDEKLKAFLQSANEARINAFKKALAEREKALAASAHKRAKDQTPDPEKQGNDLKPSETKLASLLANPFGGLGNDAWTKNIEIGMIGFADEKSIEVLQVIDKNTVLVDWPRISYRTISSGMQRIGGGGGSYRSPVSNQQIVFINIPTESLYDGLKLKVSGVWTFDKKLTYDTILGAQKTLPLGREIKVDVLR
jgi:hypothetical protein